MVAGELAPDPAVDDDPIATMVIGLPLLRLSATRVSELGKRIMENGASQVGVALSLRAAIGKAAIATRAATANARLAGWANPVRGMANTGCADASQRSKAAW